jgi:hypothetical protein
LCWNKRTFAGATLRELLSESQTPGDLEKLKQLASVRKGEVIALQAETAHLLEFCRTLRKGVFQTASRFSSLLEKLSSGISPYALQWKTGHAKS